MNTKKRIIFASFIIFTVFLFVSIPVDYLACSIIPIACNFFGVVDNENDIPNDSIEIIDTNIKLEIAFPEIEVGNMVYLTTSNDGSGRIFVATREGIIFYIEKDSNDVQYS